MRRRKKRNNNNRRRRRETLTTTHTHTITYNLLFCILNLFMRISLQRRQRISVRSQTPSPQSVIAKPLAADIDRYVESFVVCS
jgi:hypothetical protein